MDIEELKGELMDQKKDKSGFKNSSPPDKSDPQLQALIEHYHKGQRNKTRGKVEK